MLGLLAFVVLQDWLGAGYNGVYVDNLGDAFVIDAPYSIWGTFDGRHYAAFNVLQAGVGQYSGDFEDATSMVVGWTQSPSKNGQEAALRSLMQDYPYDSGQSPPLEIPYVPAPQSPADSGHLKVTLAGVRTTLNLTWRTMDDKVVYSDSIFFAGKAPAISMNGTYKAGDFSFSISEVGNTARRSFDGLVTLAGKQYALHGNRAWTRGAFTLSTPANPAVIGRGWLEWEPSARFTRDLLKGRTGPTDRIEVYIDLVNGEYPDGIHKVLTRE